MSLAILDRQWCSHSFMEIGGLLQHYLSIWATISTSDLPTMQEQLGKKQIAVRQDPFEVTHWPDTST